MGEAETPPEARAAPAGMDWLVRPKPLALMMLLKESDKEHNVSTISKRAGISYVHTIEILRKLEHEGIVQTETAGNKRMVRLTDKGSRIVSALEELMKTAHIDKV